WPKRSAPSSRKTGLTCTPRIDCACGRGAVCYNGTMSPREIMLGSFQAALAAADPVKIVPACLPRPPKGRTLVVGAGKAAASMALAVEANWPAEAPLTGLVITRYRHGLLTNRITVVEAGHPVPDESGEQAAHEILRLVKSLTPEDQLLALVSGGGSALL